MNFGYLHIKNLRLDYDKGEDGHCKTLPSNLPEHLSMYVQKHLTVQKNYLAMKTETAKTDKKTETDKNI
jgi:hypothetical protein